MMDSTESMKPTYGTKAAIIERLKEIVQDTEGTSKSELDTLKQVFYRLHMAEQEKAHKEYIAQGGDPASYVPAIDEEEVAFKAEMNLIKERRNALLLEQDKMKADNLEKKLAIVERIKYLAEHAEEASQAYDEVKQLQADWKSIGAVPAEKATEIWKNYQLHIEQYYDVLKINSEIREYDFKKNLEVKIALCEEAEKLTEETDVIEAFRKLQNLHVEFRDCGPVAKDLREEIWKRFKDASSIINKRHQQHFEEIKNKEQANLEAKTALCEQLESVDLAELNSAQKWNDMTQKVIELQEEWKKIGFAPQKLNGKIFERFRAACDKFFTAKSEFFKNLKESTSQNLKLKLALCEKAEELKESTDWKKTTEILTQLQKEWKAIGPVAKKESEIVWKRFIEACDYFFEKKEQTVSNVHKEERDNLKKKKEIVEKLKALVEEQAEDLQASLRAFMKEWNETGHVPFKDKDKLYEEYKTVVDSIYKKINSRNSSNRLNKFKNAIKERVQEGNGLMKERERLIRSFENMKAEIQTYENNIGFLTSTSKKGNGLVAEITRKVEKLKDDLELLKKKIAAIDEGLKEQGK
ncbi:MAG: DUF349 domain-containing protein [Bacteroidales bacterium]|nr:DUF349 domain-containing protein [Bacteroidales bacterium]